MNEKCQHHDLLNMIDTDGFPTWDENTKCPTCNKLKSDIYSDLNDIDPTELISQQPHGKSTLYCNKCQMMVKPIIWENHKCCPYHQRTYDDGTLLYDEVEQDDY